MCQFPSMKYSFDFAYLPNEQRVSRVYVLITGNPLYYTCVFMYITTHKSRK